MDEWMDGWMDGQPFSQPVSQPAIQSASQSVRQPVSQSVSQPVSQPANRSVSQSASQSASQPVSQPVSRPASRVNIWTDQILQSQCFVVEAGSSHDDTSDEDRNAERTRDDDEYETSVARQHNLCFAPSYTTAAQGTEGASGLTPLPSAVPLSPLDTSMLMFLMILVVMMMIQHGRCELFICKRKLEKLILFVRSVSRSLALSLTQLPTHSFTLLNHSRSLTYSRSNIQ